MSAGKKSAEDRLLERLRCGLPNRERRASGLTVGIGDDAAVWRPRRGRATLLTCDWFLEDSHFLADRHPPRLLAKKALARAVSDVAAMGGVPRCFLLSLALPARRTGRWLGEFTRGLREAAKAFRCAAAGGDTTRREKILIHITVVGECREGRAILRSGARPGDAVFVTGRLGQAAYGLALLKAGRRPDLRDPRLERHLAPEPRLAAGAWLARRGLATAMMDLSDGLSTDLARLCAASGVGARIEASRLPAVQVEGSPREALRLALDGGDDYELLFTVAAKHAARIPREIAGTRVARVGRITRAREILLERAGSAASALREGGWDPFRGRRPPVS